MRMDARVTTTSARLGLKRFLFWKNSEKGGLRLRAQNRRSSQIFLGEFFFPKTSSLLRKLSARRSRDVKGCSRASAPFAPSEIRAAVSRSKSRRKPRMVAGSDAVARLPFRNVPQVAELSRSVLYLFAAPSSGSAANLFT